MPAWPSEGGAVALGANGTGDEKLHVRSVDGKECLDPVLIFALVEQMADAAQVAQAFLADIADEQNIVPGANAGRVQRPHIGEQDGEAARVVTDARPLHLDDVGAQVGEDLRRPWTGHDA